MFIIVDNKASIEQNLPISTVDGVQGLTNIPNNVDFYVNEPITFKIQ